MMAKVLVAFLAGFAVAVPSTFWLLKKVRIKSKIRHFQVSLALGLSTALFTYLLQTKFALPVIVVTVSFALVIAAIELTLRRIVASVTSTRTQTFGMFRIGASVPLEEARSASGNYPYDYFTEDLKAEIHLFAISRQSQLKTYIELNGRVPSQKSYMAFNNISFRGMYGSMTNGIRSTTNIPPLSMVDQNVYLFGGSTMFCAEVPDNLTISSFLQRLFNISSNSLKVHNCGLPGATTVDRTRMLMEVVEIKRGDVAVFYIGDNDSGWIDHRTGKLSQQLVPFYIKASRGLADFGSETARWIYGEFAHKSFRKFSNLAVADTIIALNEAHEYCLNKGAHMIAVLQPNLYTLQTKSEYEKRLEKRFSQDLRTLIVDAYKQYERCFETESYGVSATHIFNNAPTSVFLDWAHANARGSELIAKFMYEELKKRKLISVDEEV